MQDPCDCFGTYLLPFEEIPAQQSSDDVLDIVEHVTAAGNDSDPLTAVESVIRPATSSIPRLSSRRVLRRNLRQVRRLIRLPPAFPIWKTCCVWMPRGLTPC